VIIREDPDVLTSPLPVMPRVVDARLLFDGALVRSTRVGPERRREMLSSWLNLATSSNTAVGYLMKVPTVWRVNEVN
jgi:hypothetical protein